MKKRMTIGVQLGALVGIALLLMVIILGVTVYEFKETSTAYQMLLSGTVPRTIELQRAQDDFHEGLSELRGYIAYNDSKYAADTVSKLNKSQQAVKKIATEVTRKESKQVGDKLQVAMVSYIEEIKQVITLKQANDPSYSTVLAGTRQKTEVVNALFTEAMENQDTTLKERVRQLNERQDMIFTIVIVSSTIGIILIITFLVLYSRQLARRIGNLRGDILSLSELDLSKPDVYPTRNDEIGDMAEALIKMKQVLKEIVRLLRSNADTLAASSEELSSSMEEQLQVSENIAKTITDVAAGSDRNTHHITEISAIIQEVGASAQEVSASTSHVNGVTQDAVGDADQGMQLIRKLVVLNL